MTRSHLPAGAGSRPATRTLAFSLAAGLLAALGTAVTVAPGAQAADTPPTGWTTVINKTSGKCVDARAAAATDGTAVQQYTCNSTTAQQWQLVATSNGNVRVNNKIDATRVWDVADVSTADNALVHLWAYGGGANQQWKAVSEGNGYYHFVNLNSGKCLDMPAASTADSVQFGQYTCNGTGAQSFSFGTTTTTPTPPPTTTPSTGTGLDDAHKKDIAMQLVSSAENSSLDWKAQYAYIEDIGDGRGYTGGIIGFCSGTSDMLALVEYYTTQEPGNPLATYLPALRAVNGTDSHAGLGSAFVAAWKTAATDTVFQAAQNEERDRVYFNPAVQQAKADGLRALGQFAYYDAMVMHGPGDDGVSFGGIRATAMKKAKTPAQGGDETTYLNAYLDARKAAMLTEAAHDDTSRVDTEQRVFLNAGNLDLNPPLTWKTYGDSYTISS